ncbi:MAG: hypothetical protein AAFV96_12965, partial [Pseudomonadota bacterium]
MSLALAAIGVLLALAAIVMLIRIMLTARRIQRGEAGEDATPVMRRMVLENGIALALAFLG